jgi:heterotetrameric sarcosine oxidase gamma subunit
LPNNELISIRMEQDCMGETVPIARSPITPAPPVTVVAGWEISARHSSAPLRLVDCTACSKTLIRANARGATAHLLGVDQGRARSDDSGRLVANIVYEQWLVIGSPGLPSPSHLAANADGGTELVTVVDLTHARALIRIVGTESAKVMSKLCAIDFGDRASPDNTALRTSMAGLVVEIVRNDLANHSRSAADQAATLRSYLVSCERSAGQYLFDTLLDAGQEFGIDVEGFGVGGL